MRKEADVLRKRLGRVKQQQQLLRAFLDEQCVEDDGAERAHELEARLSVAQTDLLGRGGQVMVNS